MVPHVAAVRIEESWDTPGPSVRCVARLTRPLSPEETGRMAAFPAFKISGDLVTYLCRPQEAEEHAAKLAALLRMAARPSSSPKRRGNPRGAQSVSGGSSDQPSSRPSSRRSTI